MSVADAGDLDERIAAFGEALSHSDIDAARRYVADDLTIISLDGRLRTYDRTWWEAMVPNFRLTSFDLRQEFVVRRGDTAVHHRYAQMASRVGDAERTGLFYISDYWVRGEAGWLVWQRTSLPVLDHASLPEEFPA